MAQLGLQDTALRPNADQMKRMAKGHNQYGKHATSPWPIYAWYAAGGLRSTARDMLSFGEANLGHTEVNGKPVPADSRRDETGAEAHLHFPERKQSAGDGLVNNMGNGAPGVHPVIVKNGGTDGFSTAITINDAKDLAVFVGVNQSRVLAAGKAIEISRGTSPAKWNGGNGPRLFLCTMSAKRAPFILIGDRFK